jgi:hypothetical protein
MDNVLEKQNRNNLLHMANRETIPSEILDLTIQCIKSFKNRKIAKSDFSQQSKGYSNQDIKSFAIAKFGNLLFKDKMLIASKIAATSSISFIAFNSIINQTMETAFLQSTPTLYTMGVASFLTIYATKFLNKSKNRHLTEENIAKKILSPAESDPDFFKSLKNTISEYIHSDFSIFFAKSNKFGINLIHNMNKFIKLSLFVATESPTSIMAEIIKFINSKTKNDLNIDNIDNKDSLNQQKNNENIQEDIKGNLYHQFYIQINKQIINIENDTKSNNDIDVKIKKWFSDITKSTYSEILSLNVNLVARQQIDKILHTDLSNSDNVIETIKSLKILNGIRNLSNDVSNDPLNKYTLLSNSVDNFFNKFQNLNSQEFKALQDDKSNLFNNTLEKEYNKIKSKFSKHQIVIDNELNVLFEHTLINEKPIFKNIFKKHKEILIQEKNSETLSRKDNKNKQLANHKNSLKFN